MKDIDPTQPLPRTGDHAEDDDSTRMRALLRQCCDQLRQGRAPELDLTGLTASNGLAVAELARVTATLTQKNIGLMLGLDSLRDGFAVFGTDRRLIHANRSFRNFFGQKTRIDVGVHFQTLVDAIERNQLVDLTQPGMDDWADRALRAKGETQLLRFTSGQLFRWYLKEDGAGNLVCMATDVAAELNRQHELERLMAEARRAAEAKTSFLAHMSHELRTPMNGVIGMAELLCDSGLDPEHQRYAETIRNSAEALLAIINDILDFARGRGEPIALNERAFDLEEMAIEVATLLQPQARGKGLDLRVLYDPLTPVAWIGDMGRVRQVIVNLLGNAVKYTVAGFVRLQIMASAQGLNILVHDSGPGIPDDKADSIFDEFSQLAEPGVTGISGSGLGLAITSQLVAALGGRLWLSSTPGEGSVFGVILPMRPCEAEALPPSPPAAPEGRVIAVHDTRPLARHLRRMFALSGIPLEVPWSYESLAEALDRGPRPRVVMLFCNDDLPEAQRRIALVRARAPQAQLWLLIPASKHCSVAEAFDRIVTLPQTRRGLVQPVLELLTTPDLRSPAAPESAAEEPRSTGQRRMRVLVADDNATNRLVVEKMLRNCTLDLAFAENGQQALDMWRSARPDLILMDVSMPVMDGREATRMIRRIEATETLPRTRVVAVTAAVSEDDRVDVLHAGMDEVVTKPVRRAILLEQIARFAPTDVLPPVTVIEPQPPAPGTES